MEQFLFNRNINIFWKKPKSSEESDIADESAQNHVTSFRFWCVECSDTKYQLNINPKRNNFGYSHEETTLIVMISIQIP